MTTITREQLELAAKAANLESVGTARMHGDGTVMALELVGGPYVVRWWEPHTDPADAWQLAADCRLVLDFEEGRVFYPVEGGAVGIWFGDGVVNTALEAVTLVAAEIGGGDWMNESAFPVVPPLNGEYPASTGYPHPSPGMTLRDYFAAKATDEDIKHVLCGYDDWTMARLLAIRLEDVRNDPHGAMFKARVKARYIWANAMLAERAKT